MHGEIKDGSVEAGLLLLSMHFEGQRLSCGDIAEVCGVSIQAIHKLECRALEKARKLMEKRGIQPHDIFDRSSEPAATAKVALTGHSL